MASVTWPRTSVSFRSPCILYPDVTRADVTLSVLLYVLQQLIVPLAAGSPRGPATLTNDCNVYCLTQVWFPWPVRSQLTTLDRYSMCCLAGYARVLVFVLSLMTWYFFCFNAQYMCGVHKNIGDHGCMLAWMISKTLNHPMLVTCCKSSGMQGLWYW